MDTRDRAVRFQLLGPLQLLRDGRPVPLGGIKQRAALGYLLLHANRVVSTSDLIRALWAEAPPLTARKVLQNAVAGLRATLRPDGGEVSLASHRSGYALYVEPPALDLTRFRQLAEQGRAELAAGASERAAGSLRAALALWKGSVLADLAESGVMWAEMAAIRGARMVALENCFDAELACGRHHEVAAELGSLVAAEPNRERLCAQLMVALYRCGRQVDALNVYRRVHAELSEGLGLEPGRELQRLERAILNHDPALGGPAAAGHHAAPGPAPLPAPVPAPAPDWQAEVTVALDVLELTRRRRLAHLVTVLGAPGTGKSRLVDELRSILGDRSDVHCLGDGRRPSAGALPGVLADRAGVRDTDPAPAAAEKLLQCLRRMAAGRPLLLAVEDLDCADDTVLDILDGLVRTTERIPLLVVATARPEFARRRPGWGAGGARATTLTLLPGAEHGPRHGPGGRGRRRERPWPMREYEAWLAGSQSVPL